MSWPRRNSFPLGWLLNAWKKRRFGFFELSLGYLPYTYIIYAPHIFGSVVRPWIWIPYYVRFDVYIYISMGIWIEQKKTGSLDPVSPARSRVCLPSSISELARLPSKRKMCGYSELFIGEVGVVAVVPILIFLMAAIRWKKHPCSMDSICPARLEFAQYGAKLHRKVKDDHNCDFILKLFAKIGLAVPGTIHPQRALIEIAKEQDLLGDTATTTDIEACGWIFCWVQKQPIHLLNLHVFINIGIPDVKRAWRHTWPWTSHSFPMRPSLSGMGIAGGWPAQGAAAVCHPPGWSESRVKEHLDRKMLGYLKTI